MKLETDTYMEIETNIGTLGLFHGNVSMVPYRPIPIMDLFHSNYNKYITVFDIDPS